MRRTFLRSIVAPTRRASMLSMPDPRDQPKDEKAEAAKKKKGGVETFLDGFRDLGSKENREKYRNERPKGGAEGQSGDMIFNNFFRKSEVAGTLRDNRSLTDFLGKEDMAQFMEVKDAAKRLGIEEKDLAKLTPIQVEEKWAKMMENKRITEQNELSAAAEVLIGYIATPTQREVLAAHNRKVMNDFKMEMARKKEDQYEEGKFWLMKYAGFGVFGAGFILVFATIYVHINKEGHIFDDVYNNTKNFIYKRVGFVPKDEGVVEPPPDYTTRYRDTKSSLELHEENKDIHMGALDPTTQHIMEQRHEKDREDERLVVEIFNEVMEEESTSSKEQKLVESRVRVIRKEDLEVQESDLGDIVLKNGVVLTPLREFSFENIKNFLFGLGVMAFEAKNAAKKSWL